MSAAVLRAVDRTGRGGYNAIAGDGGLPGGRLCIWSGTRREGGGRPKGTREG